MSKLNADKDTPAIHDLARSHETVARSEVPRGNPLRVLHVEDDSVDAMCVDRYLKDQLPNGCVLDFVDNLESAICSLEKRSYDAILLDLGLPDSVGLDTLKRVVDCQKSAPILVLSGDENPAKVAQAIREGAQEFLFKSRLDGEFLAEALRRALAQGTAAAADTATAPTTKTPDGDRRTDPRYLVSKSAVVFPIGPDGHPGRETVASVVELSLDGMVVVVDQARPASDLCLVGVERPDGTYAYATVRWQDRSNPRDALHLKGTFVTGHADPLDKSKLVPRLNTTTLKLEPLIQESILRKWALIGVARPYLIDRVKVCPSCQAIPTFREGCQNCGSARIASRRLIHHFACAHVADMAAFETGDTLTCPKCRGRNLVVGADFEHLSGPLNCLDCSQSDGNLILIGECLRCGSRFPGSEASTAEVIQSHVERLDPLAVIEAC